jgi:translocation and assembly module TamB
MTSLSQLNDTESQLNKQVFSLLLFNSFIESGGASDEPLAYELTATARTSVSRLLTNQLNSFADRYIKGFDINVAVLILTTKHQAREKQLLPMSLWA